MRRNTTLISSNKDKWDPSKGDFVAVNSADDAKELRFRIKKQFAIIFFLSFSTISIFFGAIYYFSL